MQITPNFNDNEFMKTSHKVSNVIPLKYIPNLHKLANTLQIIRDEFGTPIRINSGYRSEEVNKLVGGSKTSDHLTASAADITSIDNQMLWDIIMQLGDEGKIEWGQLIDEHNLRWIHISIPTAKHKGEVFSIS